MMDEVEVEDTEKDRILLGAMTGQISWRRGVLGNTLGVVKEWLGGWIESGLGNVRKADSGDNSKGQV